MKTKKFPNKRLDAGRGRVEAVTPAEFQRRLAEEFDRRGWHYDLSVGREALSSIPDGEAIDGTRVARAVSQTFLERNGVSRTDVADAIDRAVGGHAVSKALVSSTLVINDNRYQVNLGEQSRIDGSAINVGSGTQINVNASVGADEILRAVEAMVRAGVAGEWNQEAARDLASLIEARGDVSFEDVHDKVVEVVTSERPRREAVKAFLKDVAAGGIGGALGTGISAALGEIMGQLPL